jgi:uncharacterized protein involved in high-affinity Fe2+ transport
MKGLTPRPVTRGLALLALVTLGAGCAAADKTASHHSAAGSPASAQGSQAMAGMSMGSGSGAPSVAGIKPVPTQVLAQTTWQGMRIRAMAMTAVPFLIYDGTSEQVVRPSSRTSFHLMVALSDSQTNQPIPYASVWATISRASRIVYDERQWPMISRYMGPHYGNDVSLPGTGSYQLSLLISPPVSARHLEYQNVWLHPHRVTVTFHWKPAA